LPLDQLAGALRERANSDTERVELFQAKLPVEAIASYGAFVLIISQFYLLAHLLELRRMAQALPRPDWPTGYVGLYKRPRGFCNDRRSYSVLASVAAFAGRAKPNDRRALPLLRLGRLDHLLRHSFCFCSDAYIH
jgi:hypothetical protein